MKVKAQVPPDQKTENTKSRFRLEIARHNHRVIITDSIDKGRYRSYMISYYIEGSGHPGKARQRGLCAE